MRRVSLGSSFPCIHDKEEYPENILENNCLTVNISLGYTSDSAILVSEQFFYPLDIRF